MKGDSQLENDLKSGLFSCFICSHFLLCVYIEDAGVWGNLVPLNSQNPNKRTSIWGSKVSILILLSHPPNPPPPPSHPQKKKSVHTGTHISINPSFLLKVSIPLIQNKHPLQQKFPTLLYKTRWNKTFHGGMHARACVCARQKTNSKTKLTTPPLPCKHKEIAEILGCGGGGVGRTRLPFR